MLEFFLAEAASQGNHHPSYFELGQDPTLRVQWRCISISDLFDHWKHFQEPSLEAFTACSSLVRVSSKPGPLWTP
jgi:hypothetical protein